MEQPPEYQARADDDGYALGVLFVHGIGEQQRGETLGTWATALTRWLRGWFGADDASGAEVELCRVAVDRVRPSPDRDGPEAASLRVRIPDDQREWLLAESWWAQEVTAPKIGELGSWLVRVVPFLAVAQVWPRVRHDFSRALMLKTDPQSDDEVLSRVSRLFRAAGAALLLMLMVPLSTLVVVAIWLLLVVLRLPLPGWRSRIDGVVRAVAGTLGDSYLLTQNPLQYDRMRDALRSDLEAVAATCATVAVVAHSQGAAIAHDVLRELAADARRGVTSARRTALRVRLFASVGSGIWKLTRLRDLLYGLKRGVSLAPVWGMLSCTAAVAVGTLVAGPLAWLSVPLAGIGAVLLVRGLWDTFRTVPPRPDTLELDPDGFHERFRWVDFWATSDPVSNGPLVEPHLATGSRTPRTRKLHNMGSIVRDHTSYTGNYDQFWPLLAGELFAADPAFGYWSTSRDNEQFHVVPVPEEQGQERFVRAWRQRENRVRWATWSRTATVALAVLAFFTAPGLRRAAGERVLDVCAAWSVVPDAMSSACAGAPPATVSWWLRPFTVSPAAAPMLGGVALVAAAFAVGVGLRTLWRTWQRATDEVVVHHRRPADPSSIGRAYVATAAAPVVGVFLAAMGMPGLVGGGLAWVTMLWLLGYYAWLVTDTLREWGVEAGGAAAPVDRRPTGHPA